MGRVERRLLRIAGALTQQGASVSLVCAPRSPLEAEANKIGVEVAPYKLDRFNYIRTRSRMQKYLARGGHQVAHSCGYDADILLRMAAKGTRTAAINTIPCIDFPRAAGDPLTRFTRRMLDARTRGNASAIVTDCRRVAEQLVAADFAPGDIMLDPPSIDIAEVKAQAEQPLDISGVRGPLIGYGGRIEESRGLENLVAASAILDARGVTAQAVIAGEGPLLRSLKENVRSSRVKYLGWVDSVPAALKRFEVAVFPSTLPGVPTSLLEAAALGRPIVATRVEGVEELFEDFAEIRLVPPGDPKGLAAAIADLIEDREAAGEMAERAQHRVMDEYSSAASIERHLTLYRRFMKK